MVLLLHRALLFHAKRNPLREKITIHLNSNNTTSSNTNGAIIEFRGCQGAGRRELAAAVAVGMVEASSPPVVVRQHRALLAALPRASVVGRHSHVAVVPEVGL